MVIAALALTSALPGGAMLDPRAVVELGGAAIRVGDVVRDVGGSVGRIEIARLPAGRSSVTLSRQAVAALVRRAVPALALDSGGTAPITFRRVLPPSSPACFVARDAISAGEAIGADQVRAGTCAAAPVPTHYEAATGTIVAVTRIAAGGVVGNFLPRTAPEVSRGDALTLVSRIGPVRVERAVAALQPGRRGGRVFVRSSDGQVFAAPVAADRP